ncbi:hypothetical protein ANTPLA_LOCUS4232 [Anthophora plagiata]
MRDSSRIGYFCCVHCIMLLLLLPSISSFFFFVLAGFKLTFRQIVLWRFKYVTDVQERFQSTCYRKNFVLHFVQQFRLHEEKTHLEDNDRLRGILGIKG